jgi:hypothetical protein
MFYKIDLTYSDNFRSLSTGTIFEDITKGRKGAVLADLTSDKVPLVRTTTRYNNPVQAFTDVHYQLMDIIRSVDSNLLFNNALIEIYNDNYVTMGFHSDQALDLEENSYICIFSCYENANEPFD